MAGLKPEYIEETSKEISILLELWMKVRDFLKIANSGDPITKEDESTFLKVKSDGTKYHRILKKKLTDQTTRIKNLDFDYDRMIEILRGSISILHLRGLPEADMKKTSTEWHRVYIGLCHVAGAYDFLQSDQIKISRGTKRPDKKKGPLGKVLGIFKRG